MAKRRDANARKSITFGKFLQNLCPEKKKK